MPGLDGVRAVAVGAVLAYHLGVPGASGGFLGVSVFFTLSGFLITALLLRGHERSGRVELLEFWARRIRRLLPAALLCITLVVIWAWVDALPRNSRFGGDVLAALANVANWRFILTGTSYADLFQSPSPVLHFWSLAIEEQFYFTFPIVTALALRHSRRRLALILTAALIGSLALTLAVTDPNAVYFATGTRAAELLVGCLLAIALSRVSMRASRRIARMRQAAGLVGLSIVLAAITTWDLNDDFLYRGGFAAFAVASAAMVSAAAMPGPISRALGVWPLRTIGRVSYGIYLFHWPIFLALNEERLGFGGVQLGALRLGATFSAAALSYVAVEQPIRERRALSGRIAPASAVSALATVAALALIVGQFAPATSTALSGAADRFAVFSVNTAPPRGMAKPAARGIPVVAFFGDSIAMAPGGAFGQWGKISGRAQLSGGVINFSCGISRGGARVHHNTTVVVDDGCPNWETTWGAFLDEHRSNAAVVMVGPEDVEDRVLPGTSAVSHIGSADVDANLVSEILTATRLIESHGAVAIWLTCPHLQFGRDRVPPPPDEAMNEPSRVDRFNELLSEAAHQHPSIKIVDLASYLTGIPGGEFAPAYRPDGVHLTDDGADAVVQSWLGDAILAVIPPAS